MELIVDELLSESNATRLAEWYSALGDPTRLRLISALLDSERHVQALAELLGMSESAISHQLRLLRQLRIVRARRQGKQVIYSLDDEHIAEMFRLGLAHFNHRWAETSLTEDERDNPHAE
jgi:DNA-binding transcriptional ArsR family regulator